MFRQKAIWLLLAAYVAVLAAMTGLPWGDLPNHLTRITIIGELLSSPSSYYHQHYSFHWMFVPYILWDVLAAGTSRLLPVEANGVLWTVITFLTVVSGGWYLARVRLKAEADWRALTAFSVLMASGWCFAWGFFGFQLSLGLCLLAVACGDRLRERRSSLSKSVAGLAYTALIVACYLAHLGGFLALCVILGSAALARVIRSRDQLISEAAALAPAVLLGAWYVYARASSALQVPEAIVQRTPLNKLQALASPWLRFPLRWDWPVLLGLALAVALLFIGAAAAFRSRARDVLVNDLFFPVVALGGVYLVLPQAQGQAWDVDVRMLPFLVYFLLLWLLSIARPAGSPAGLGDGFLPPGRVLFGTCWVSLLVLLIQIWPYNREAHKYWEALKRIPEHQVVLAVSTRPYLGRLLPLQHEGNLYAVFREGVAPDVFSSDNAAFPFFVPREPYAPPPNLWYVRNLPTPKWESLDLRYDYLVVSKPYDPARLSLPAPRVFTENDAVVVFRLSGTEDVRSRAAR